MRNNILDTLISNHGDVIQEIFTAYGLGSIPVNRRNLASAIVLHGVNFENELKAISNFDDGTEDFLNKIRSKVKQGVVGKVVNKALGKPAPTPVMRQAPAPVVNQYQPPVENTPRQIQTMVQSPNPNNAVGSLRSNSDQAVIANTGVAPIAQPSQTATPPIVSNNIVAPVAPSWSDNGVVGGGGGGMDYAAEPDKEATAKAGFNFKKWLPVIIGGSLLVIGGIIFFVTRKK